MGCEVEVMPRLRIIGQNIVGEQDNQ